MISLSGAKPSQLIQKIQQHESAPQTLSALYSPDEIEQLKQWAVASYENSDHTQQKLLKKNGKPLGNMAHPQGEVKEAIEKLLRAKLKDKLEEPYGLAFTFHRNYFPYGTHTDSGYDPDEYIYKQGIIPLEVDPDGAEVYTVIFQQKAYHSVSYPGKVETIASLKPEELEHIHGLDNNNDLSDEELSRYFQGPSDRERFKGFEIALPFRWQKGNMALWDRAHLHCSSDFSNHSINGKMGLMWISWRI